MFESVEAFYRPASVREALKLLQNGKGSARIVAGCTDAIVEGDRSPRFLIDITRAGLTYIKKRGDGWAIGSTTTMAEIEESPLHSVAGGLLAAAAATCGSVEIRNVATVGGNMANGSPAADLATPLLVLDATAVVADQRGRRKMTLADYLAAVRNGAMRKALLIEVAFPDPPRGGRCGWSFQKFGRTALDISVVNAAAGLQLDSRGCVKWARIALGAVAPAPVRMPAAEAAMAGRPLDRDLLAEVGGIVMRSVDPISDVRGPAEYRREISGVLAARALEACAAQAGCLL